MIKRQQYQQAQQRAAELIRKTGVNIRAEELERIDVADLGLSELEESGVEILTLVDTEKIAVKLLVLFPNQIEPEHLHPQIEEYPGKEETIRCEWGVLYLYGPGEPTLHPRGCPPPHRRHTYTVWHEYILKPGDQVTFQPGIPHWFQAGSEGAVIWSFSTKVIDVKDEFTDPDVIRTTIVVDD
jgi:D-lyxose ketol-isomerase